MIQIETIMSPKLLFRTVTHKKNKKKNFKLLDDSVSTANTVDSSIVPCLRSAFSKNNNNKNRVRFGDVRIDWYCIELGGSGVPRVGPNIALGSTLSSKLQMSLEDYEAIRPSRRPANDLYIPRRQRTLKLIQAGYSRAEIRINAQQGQRIRLRRDKTVQKLAQQQTQQQKVLNFFQILETAKKRANPFALRK